MGPRCTLADNVGKLKVTDSLLKYLYSLSFSPSKPSCIVQIRAEGEKVVYAHQAMLVASSPVLGGRYRFGDPGKAWNASEFSAAVVQAVIKFMYVGVCEVLLADVGAIFALADMWQIETLQEAAMQYIHRLPAAACLRALSDCSACVPGASLLGRALANRVVAGFKMAASALPRPEGWQFLREIHEVKVDRPESLLEQWGTDADNEDTQAETQVTAFFVAALRSVRSARCAEMEQLVTPHVKGILSSTSALHVVEQLCQKPGIIDEDTGSVSTWIYWTYSGPAQLFGRIWEVYRHLQQCFHAARQASDATSLASHHFNQGELQLPSEVENGFAVAIAGSLENGTQAVEQWEQLFLQGTFPVIQESMLSLATILRCSPKQICNFSARTTVSLLQAAMVEVPVDAVRVSGSAVVTGVFKRSGKGVNEFRSCKDGASAKLVLQRIAREKGSFYISWRGIPINVIQNAKAEWKIHRECHDRDTEIPLAIAFSESIDPCRIYSQWWVYAGKGRFEAGNLSIVAETMPAQAAAHFVDALLSWTSRGGELSDLAREAAQGHSALVGQICNLAEQRLARKSSTNAESPEHSLSQKGGVLPVVKTDSVATVPNHQSAQQHLLQGPYANVQQQPPGTGVMPSSEGTGLAQEVRPDIQPSTGHFSQIAPSAIFKDADLDKETPESSGEPALQHPTTPPAANFQMAGVGQKVQAGVLPPKGDCLPRSSCEPGLQPAATSPVTSKIAGLDQEVPAVIPPPASNLEPPLQHPAATISSEVAGVDGEVLSVTRPDRSNRSLCEPPTQRPAATPSQPGARLLASALEKCSNAQEVLRFANLLRAWAHERRPYRGHIFSTQEIDEAVSAFSSKQMLKSSKDQMDETTSSVHDASTRDDIHKEIGNKNVGMTVPLATIYVKVNATHAWPPPSMADTVLKVACNLGPCPTPSTTAFGSKTLALLQKLFNLTSSSKTSDFQVSTQQTGVLIWAHRDILSITSPVIACLHNSNGSLTKSCWNASLFSTAVVQAAKRFMYLGECEVDVADLRSLYRLADIWQVSVLQQTILELADHLAAAHSIVALAGGPQDTFDESDLVRALIARSSAGFDFAATQLEVNPPQWEGWMFLEEWHQALSFRCPSTVSSLQRWNTSNLDLKKQVRRFFVAALKVAPLSSIHWQRLSATPVRSILSDAEVYQVVDRLCLEMGVRDGGGGGGAKPWVHWAFSSRGQTFSQIWTLYLQLKNHLGTISAVQEQASSTTSSFEEEGMLPDGLEDSFAAAIADALEAHAASVGDCHLQWEQLLLDSTPPYPVIQRSMMHVARILKISSRRLIGFSSRAVLHILREALVDVPADVIRVQGHAAVEGMYKRATVSGAQFYRTGETTLSPLVLHRIPRKSVRVAWKGVPASDLQRARVEWKIQAKSDDAETDMPLAIALTETQDPCKIGARWLIAGSKGRFAPGDMCVTAEALSPEDAAPFVAAVLMWVKEGGDLTALVDTVNEDVDGTAVIAQICQIALAQDRAAGTGQAEGPDRKRRRCVDSTNAKAA